MLKQAGKVGMRDHFLDNPVLTVLRRIRELKTKGVSGRPLDTVLEVSLLFVKQGLSIRYQVLQVADLGTIRGRVKDLSDHSLEESEPNSAVTGIGCAHPVFVAMRPFGVNPGLSKGDPIRACFSHPIAPF